MYLFVYNDDDWVHPIPAACRDKKQLAEWAKKYCEKKSRDIGDDVPILKLSRAGCDANETALIDLDGNVYGWITSGVKELPSKKKRKPSKDGLTFYQRYLARSCNPLANGDCTMKQVHEWRMKLAGTSVDDRSMYQFLAINKDGKLKWFDYCHSPKWAKTCGCDDKEDYFNYYVVKEKAATFAMTGGNK